MVASKSSPSAKKTSLLFIALVAAVVVTTTAVAAGTGFFSSARTPVGQQGGEDRDNGNGRVAWADMKDVQGAVVGSVRFTEMNGSVLVRAQIEKGLTPGFHGFHVHTAGKCDAPGFTTAGGHLNTSGATHSRHDGDMPSLLIHQDGTGSLDFETDTFTLSDLIDTDGSAVIVHAGADNFANIPTRYVSAPDTTTLNTGDAGARALCGVVTTDRSTREDVSESLSPKPTRVVYPTSRVSLTPRPTVRITP